MERFADRLRTFAENVLTLEVNTIACDDISGQKMPHPEHAVIDIATWYRNRLCDEHGRKDLWGHDEKPAASRELFLRIREAAKDLIEKDGDKDGKLLRRIKGNSDQLKAIFERLDEVAKRAVVLSRARGAQKDALPESIDLLPEEIVTVRKAWELGVDEVLIQTSIQIDADVVTRLSRGLGDHADGPAAMKVHEKAVAVSIASWDRLVTLIGKTLRSLVEIFVGK
jgi:hypothetical protein